MIVQKLKEKLPEPLKRVKRKNKQDKLIIKFLDLVNNFFSTLFMQIFIVTFLLGTIIISVTTGQATYHNYTGISITLFATTFLWGAYLFSKKETEVTKRTKRNLFITSILFLVNTIFMIFTDMLLSGLGDVLVEKFPFFIT